MRSKEACKNNFRFPSPKGFGLRQSSGALGTDREHLLPRKRQRTGAVQNATRRTTIIEMFELRPGIGVDSCAGAKEDGTNGLSARWWVAWIFRLRPPAFFGSSGFGLGIFISWFAFHASPIEPIEGCIVFGGRAWATKVGRRGNSAME